MFIDCSLVHEHVVFQEELEIGPLCRALSQRMLLKPQLLVSKKAKTSRGKTGYLRTLGGSSNGLTVSVLTCVTHEQMSSACDSPSPSMLEGGLLLKIVMPTSGSVLQAPVGSWSADKQRLHSGGSKEPRPRSVTV